MDFALTESQEAIRDAIRSGRLLPGIQLPSSRALAELRHPEATALSAAE